MTRPLLNLGNAAAPEHVTPDNPHGWHPSLKGKGTRLDPTKLAAWADAAIATAKKADAQGVIVWNGEGARRYSQVGYEGEPRNWAAEMKALVPRFRKAGLGVGCTIRHTAIVKTDAGALIHVEPWDMVNHLLTKIDDAAKFGASDYAYIDSNCDWPLTRILPAWVFNHVHNARPDTLLIPEHEGEGYRPATMPYRESHKPRKGSPGGEVVRVFFGDEYGAKVDEGLLTQLREDLAAGSIPMIRGYDSPELEVLRSIQ